MTNSKNVKQHIFDSIDEILDKRKTADPEKSYTAKLLNEGVDNILKKVGEEATETVIASKCGDNAAIIHEIADLWFHTIVLLKYHGLALVWTLRSCVSHDRVENNPSLFQIIPVLHPHNVNLFHHIDRINLFVRMNQEIGCINETAVYPYPLVHQHLLHL